MSFVAVAFPPVQTTYQFLHAKAQSDHVHGPFGGRVTTYPVAVSNDEHVLVDGPGRLGRHPTVRYVDRAGNVFAVKRLRRTRVDDGDLLAAFAGNLEVPRVDLILELFLIMLQLILHFALATRP